MKRQGHETIARRWQIDNFALGLIGRLVENRPDSPLESTQHIVLVPENRMGRHNVVPRIAADQVVEGIFRIILGGLQIRRRSRGLPRRLLELRSNDQKGRSRQREEHQ